jgi:hypothetical protein
MNNQLQNLLQFATPTSFNLIGQDPICDPETKVPSVPFYTVSTTIKIPKICLDDLINVLETTLSSIRKIEVEKRKHFVYKIEYFPIETLKINPNTDKFYSKKHFSSLYAASKAIEKFPHNLDYDDDYNDRPTSIVEWFKAEVRLYYSKKNNNYLLEVNRMTGSSKPFYACFYNYIKEAFDEKNLLWMLRKNYVSLLDGIGPTSDHITRYLLDELVCREICTYFGVPPENHLLMIRR